MKKRWNFEYVGLDDNANSFGQIECEYHVDLEHYIDKNDETLKRIPRSTYWNDFRENSNIFLLENGINEDRLIAPFFINPSQFIKDLRDYEDCFWINELPYLNKCLMYIFDDVLKHKISVRKKLFTDDILSFSQLVKKYKTRKCIYSEEFLASLDIQEWEWIIMKRLYFKELEPFDLVEMFGLDFNLENNKEIDFLIENKILILKNSKEAYFKFVGMITLSNRAIIVYPKYKGNILLNKKNKTDIDNRVI